MNNRLLLLPLVFALASLLAACGGGPAAATALPPDVARPAQPTPVFENSARIFRLAPAPTIANPADIDSGENADIDQALSALDAAAPSGSQAHTLLRAMMVKQPPTALGVVRGQAFLRAEPGGEIIAPLFAGETTTVTGRSADSRYLAAFNAVGVPGWVAATSITLYGADDLTVVETSVGPGPVATLIAEAMATAEVSVLEGVE